MIRRSEDCRELVVLTLGHHEVKVVGKARAAHIRGGFGLCGPPELEKAVSVAGGAMTVHTVRGFDRRVQFPRPALFEPPAVP